MVLPSSFYIKKKMQLFHPYIYKQIDEIKIIVDLSYLLKNQNAEDIDMCDRGVIAAVSEKTEGENSAAPPCRG